MKKTCVILLMLAFTAVFSAGKVKVNVQNISVQMCSDYNVVALHAQKEFDLKTDKSSTPYFYEKGIFENEDSGKEKYNISNKDRFVLFPSLTLWSYLLFTIEDKLYFNEYYKNPYDTIKQFPIYLLNHVLIIPFS